jgi:cobalt-precorrin 5A hydrolase / precorrin-3B C17-methyltransferase
MAAVNKKELAIVAITRQGADAGRTIKAFLPESYLYVPTKFASGDPNEHPFKQPVSSLIAEIFTKHRQMVLIMAVGIAVRLIAPLANNKRRDPGIVAMDESSKYVVSLLSGHDGGANELARKIASFIGAQPVITTASESKGILSLDLLAKKYGWTIEDDTALTRVSAALVNDESVGIYQDAGETDWSAEELSPSAEISRSIGALSRSRCKAAVLITDQQVHVQHLGIPAAIFHPKTLVLGIGCHRGVPCDEIEEAVCALFSSHGLSALSIRSIATASLKQGEAGIMQYAEKYGLPVDYIGKEALDSAKFPSKPSAAALKHVGLSSVCEAAAIQASQGALIVPKTSFKRKITLAVARKALAVPEKRGKLLIVGLGPGDPAHMTLKARQAIAESDAVVGYTKYVDLIRRFLPGRQVVATPMGKEVERVSRAIDLAIEGRTVALISSGDPGIYGMAGLAAEMLQKRGSALALEVIPGVPAMLAAASLLGAPLNVDIASISLSDHLVPWTAITLRLDSAARADFVIALYNPKSRARRHQLGEACEIILKHRPPSTPVGIVTSAYRPGQAVVISDLGHLRESPVDMDTVIIIGNSTTVAKGDRMITPRGYHTKYNLGKKES